MTDIEPATSQWADRIRPHLAQAAESIIAAGRELAAAKADLPHGQFGPLLDELGLSRRMAQRFMAVAAHPVLGNASRVTHLPAAIGTLDELTRWDSDDLEAALDSGAVTPSTTREEAKALRARDDWLPLIPFAPLDPDTDAGLRASIQRWGVKVPIVYSAGPWCPGRIIDGHQRLRIAHELGMTDYPTCVRSYRSEGEAVEEALALNMARHHGQRAVLAR